MKQNEATTASEENDENTANEDDKAKQHDTKQTK